jgi:3-methyladenine DNA glycosylase AlkD
MQHRFHKQILKIIRDTSGKPTTDEFLNNYLGNPHVRYPINNPTLRMIAKLWMREHRDLEPETFAAVLDSLIKGESCTEKMMAGILMDYSSKQQRNFDPIILDNWLDHLVGWVEVDTVCTGDFVATQLKPYWSQWKKLITVLSKSSNINKRRASLVLFCSPLSRAKDDAIAEFALKMVTKMRSEKDILITKAVSWVLRSLIKHHRTLVSDYVAENSGTLPKIAVRETLAKLETGKKTRTSSLQN